MTVTKRKITEVESIVNKADNRKTAGKIYLPKDWIGKRVKTILLSSLIVMAFMIVVTCNQAVTASDDIRAENVLSKMEEVKGCYSLPKEGLKQCVIDAIGWNKIQVAQAIDSGMLQAFMTDDKGIVTNLINSLKQEQEAANNKTMQQQEELDKLCGGKCK